MLSKRLLALAKYVYRDDVVADIGSDHGKLALYLNKLGHPYVYASENKMGPYNRLKRATMHVDSGTIVTDFADGAAKLPANVNTVIIAGMGGELLVRILREGKEKLVNVEKLILAPNGAEADVRRLLYELNYRITKEEVLSESSQYYEIIVAEKALNISILSDKDAFFGPINLSDRGKDFIAKWQKVFKRNQELLEKDLSASRREEIMNLQILIKEVIGEQHGND